MDYYLIETGDGEVLGVYVKGFVNKQLLINDFNKVSLWVWKTGEKFSNDYYVKDANYMWAKPVINKEGKEYFTLSGKEEISSLGVTAIYW